MEGLYTPLKTVMHFRLDFSQLIVKKYFLLVSMFVAYLCQQIAGTGGSSSAQVLCISAG